MRSNIVGLAVGFRIKNRVVTGKSIRIGSIDTSVDTIKVKKKKYQKKPLLDPPRPFATIEKLLHDKKKKNDLSISNVETFFKP